MENLDESCATIQIVNKFKMFLNIKTKYTQSSKKIQRLLCQHSFKDIYFILFIPTKYLFSKNLLKCVYYIALKITTSSVLMMLRK